MKRKIILLKDEQNLILFTFELISYHFNHSAHSLSYNLFFKSFHDVPDCAIIYHVLPTNLSFPTALATHQAAIKQPFNPPVICILYII